VRTNRPREAVTALERLDPERPPTSLYEGYWDEWTLAYHLLGDNAAELAAARRGRRQHPDRLATLFAEARALAALGRVGDVARLLEEAVDLPTSPHFATGEVMRGIGVELRAHDQEDAAQAAFTRALQWWAERPEVERVTPAWRIHYAQALYTAGHWEEARRLLEPLAGLPANSKRDSDLGFVNEGPPDALDRRGFLGVIAARRGDRAAALEADHALGATRMPYLRGRHTYWRARIAALLGESDRAVALLREALRQGRTYPEVHGEVDLAPLHTSPAYQELMRPKG
jgi:tetratricopeptide (TPR) repeat protein